MKTAKVLPIYKNSRNLIVSNYRPVSLLPQFSEILEKVFFDRLYDFKEKYELLSDHQYGFRINWSTSLPVMEFVENIATAIDKDKNML